MYPVSLAFSINSVRKFGCAISISAKAKKRKLGTVKNIRVESDRTKDSLEFRSTKHIIEFIPNLHRSLIDLLYRYAVPYSVTTYSTSDRVMVTPVPGGSENTMLDLP